MAMTIDIIIYAAIGLVGGAAVSFLAARRHYLQAVREGANSAAHLQQTCRQQAAQLAQTEAEYRRLAENYRRAEIDVALGKQQIETQRASLQAAAAEKDQLLAQREESGHAIQVLTAARAELENSQREKSERLHAYKNDVDSLRRQLQQANNQISQLEADSREQQVMLRAEAEKLSELKAQFEAQKQALKIEFKAVSEEIIQERQQMLHRQNKEGVSALLKPLQERIVGFQQRVNEVHMETIKAHAHLEAAIQKVMEVGIKMGDDASNLTSALKGNSQQRGAWGEAQLERTLELSGLVAGAHYAKQSSFKDREGRRKQTDYLIKLPGDKHIIIDSKVSLLAYDSAVSAKDEAAQTQAMDEHVKSVKRHIDDLAAKDYTNLIGIHSPSFVLMFMSIEPAYIEALRHSKTLFGYGYDKNIVLVSHATLIPILRTVANLWMLDQSNHEAREISEKAGDIYNAVCTVAERLQKLGNTLNTASTQYNHAVTAVAGKKGLHGKVERFTQLSNKVSKTMPALTVRHLEHETAALDIQAIAIDGHNPSHNSSINSAQTDSDQRP